VISGVEPPGRFEWTPLYFKELHIIGSNAFGIEELRGVRKHAFEQDDRLGDPRGPERQPFLEPRNRECIRFRERQRCWNEPVPVGVGLDDCHDARPAGALPDCPQVVPQGVRIDDGPDQPVHRSTPSA